MYKDNVRPQWKNKCFCVDATCTHRQTRTLLLSKGSDRHLQRGKGVWPLSCTRWECGALLCCFTWTSDQKKVYLGRSPHAEDFIVSHLPFWEVEHEDETHFYTKESCGRSSLSKQHGDMDHRPRWVLCWRFYSQLTIRTNRTTRRKYLLQLFVVPRERKKQIKFISIGRV